MSAPIDKATAAREMLGALRLLSIRGHVPGEHVERWEAALDAGEPGTGRLAAIRGVLDYCLTSETADRQVALERIEQIVGSSRTESGIEPGGGAYLTPADLATVLGGLEDATEYRNPSGFCADCDASPSGPCGDHADDLDKAGAYFAVAAKLGGAA